MPPRPPAHLIALVGLALAIPSASAAVSVVDGDLSPGSGHWTGSGEWGQLIVSPDTFLAIQADNLTPYYTAGGGTTSTQAIAKIDLTDLVPGIPYEVTVTASTVTGYIFGAGPVPDVTLNPGGLDFLIDDDPFGFTSALPEAILTTLLDGGGYQFAGYSGTPSTVSAIFIAPAETATLGLRGVEFDPAGETPVDVTNARILIHATSVRQIPEPSQVGLTLLSAAGWLLRRKRR